MSATNERVRPDSGFLLIGVVMFVLALTILGISLYSLSSYEAEFEARSHDSNQAFFDAQGGFALVQALLAANPRLSSAKTAIGVMHVDYANAWKMVGGLPDSIGMINSSTDTITIRVRATVGPTNRRESRILTARYLPGDLKEYYKRLFTISGTTVAGFPGTTSGIFVIATNTAIDPAPATNLRLKTVWLGDTCHVWQVPAADATWENFVTWPNPGALTVAPMNPPDLVPYFAGHPTALTPTATGGAVPTLTFDKHAPGTTGFYVTPDNSNTDFSYFISPGSSLDIKVQGSVVWELPRGMRSDKIVNISTQTGAPATLVIVGGEFPGRPGGDGEVGIWFFGGLNVTDNTRVILVSDGQVNIERFSDYDKDQQATRLSIYANSLYLMGPRIDTSPAWRSRYDHMADMDADIDLLEGDLPRPAGQAPTSFTLLRGSWQDLTP